MPVYGFEFARSLSHYSCREFELSKIKFNHEGTEAEKFEKFESL